MYRNMVIKLRGEAPFARGESPFLEVHHLFLELNYLFQNGHMRKHILNMDYGIVRKYFFITNIQCTTKPIFHFKLKANKIKQFLFLRIT